MNQQLADWCNSWCSRHDAGGIVGTSTDKALQQLLSCIDKGSRVAVQQDVAGFFDSLDPAHVVLVLQHLRAPEPLVNLIRSTCRRSSRLFALQGALGSDWRSPGRGLPQGCLLSPTVAAAVSHVWAAFVLRADTQTPSQVDGYAYVDDRCIMLCPNSPLEALRGALSRSDRFDAAFGLNVSLQKCAVVGPSHDLEVQAFARERGYQHLQHLESLRIVIEFGSAWKLLKFSLRKVLLRLRLLRGICVRTRDSRALVRSLITPCFARASPYAQPDPAEVQASKHEVYPSMVRPGFFSLK